MCALPRSGKPWPNPLRLVRLVTSSPKSVSFIGSGPSPLKNVSVQLAGLAAAVTVSESPSNKKLIEALPAERTAG